MFMTTLRGKRIAARCLTTDGVLSAIRAKDIYAVYQPQFNAATGKLAGLEMLARWRTHADAHIQPSDFIPLIEQSEFESELITSMVEDAGELLHRCPEFEGTISINASLRALAHPAFFPLFEDELHFNGLPMHRILVEITENTLVSDAEAREIQKHIRRLKGEGLTFALDDFGTGFAGMQALDQFDCHQVKIAKPFLHRARASLRSRRILTSMVSVAHAAGAMVVMEGIESDEDVQLSRNAQADQLQGFFLGTPQTADQLAAAYFGNVGSLLS